uniref:Uncharacterized protein n=1 Tax=Tetranychus urticae TaxID=32264 RepID=T1KTA4_TETUR
MTIFIIGNKTIDQLYLYNCYHFLTNNNIDYQVKHRNWLTLVIMSSLNAHFITIIITR